MLNGKTWKYGDNVDTDVIIPARYLNDPDPAALASQIMSSNFKVGLSQEEVDALLGGMA